MSEFLSRWEGVSVNFTGYLRERDVRRMCSIYYVSIGRDVTEARHYEAKAQA